MQKTETKFIYKSVPKRLMKLLVCLTVMWQAVYSQNTYTFTNAGATGAQGPTQTQVNTAYASTNLNGQVTVNSGVQNWTVPYSGLFRIETFGAQGGGSNGGLGAKMTGTFNLTQGQVLKIVVGQQGVNTSGCEGGGGGGTFVALLNNTPLIVAGGGGASGVASADDKHGRTATSGGTTSTNAGGIYQGTPGTNGDGSTVGYPYLGGAGGFNTDGTTNTNSGGGKAFVNNAEGGIGTHSGGFGGGGSSSLSGWCRFGGGGGYSGGASGLMSSSFSAGGGGSYNSGIAQNNIAGVNSGMGKVIITALEGQALHFDGTNDYATAADPNFGTGDFTIEAWFKTTTGGYILTSRTGEPSTWGNWWSVSTDGSGIGVEIAECGVTGYSVVSTPTGVVSQGAWNHLAVVRSGIDFKIYVNGSLQASFTDAVVRNFNTGQNVLRFGGWPEYNGAWFNGALDEVRIWNVARTQCEITSYMNCEIPTIAAGLMRNHHFNQGMSSSNNTGINTIIDATGNSSAGLTNFALNGSTSNWISPGGVASGYTIAVAPPVVGATVSNPVICAGNTTSFNGTGANTYSWTGGVSNGVAFTPANTATYTVTGTNTLSGCSNTAVAFVTVNALPVISVNSGAICIGGTFTMSPSGANTYTFSNGSAVVAPTSNDSYSVSGTDLNGCVSSVPAVSNITVNALPVVTASISNAVICDGSSTTLFGGGADTYSWTNGVTDAVAFTPQSSGSYTVTGTNTLTGCMNTAVESVTVNSLPVVSAAISNTLVCQGASVILTGSGADTYTWTGGVTNGVAFAASSSFTYSVSGTNTLTGCTSTNSAIQSLSVHTLPSITTTVSSSAICQGNSVTMTASGADTYTWTGGINNGVAFTPSVSGTYTVTGTDTITGCSNEVVESLTVNNLPVINASSSTSLLCVGQSATLNANGAVTYTWSTSSTGSVIIVSPTVTATYTVTGEDANSCVNTATVIQNVSNCTSLEKWSATNQEINVYPNPTSGEVSIELSSEAVITLMNSAGQIILSEAFKEGKSTLELNNVSNGIYFAKIVQNGYVKTVKIIKQ